MRRAARPLGWALATACAAAAILTWSRPTVHAQSPAAAGPAAGRALYQEACAACHGIGGRGVAGKGPTLIGAGALATDFYLSTGRMPLSEPGQQPLRRPPAYGPRRRAALVAYVAAAFGGPPVPRVDVAAASLPEGRRLFTENCAGCHQVMARGGIVPPSGTAPPLQDATPTQVAEAVRIGPYTMPSFGRRQLGPRQVASIARYVRWTRRPEDRGGWGIGHIGPIPEGMVAWFLAGGAVLLIARLLGERTA